MSAERSAARALVRRCAVALAKGRLPDDPHDAVLFGERLLRYFDWAESTDEALEVARLKGAPRLSTRRALSRRDQLLCGAAAEFFSQLDTEPQAKALAKALKLYREGPWSRGEQYAPQCPEKRRGSLQEQLWLALREKDRNLGWHAVRAILQKGRLGNMGESRHKSG